MSLEEMQRKMCMTGDPIGEGYLCTELPGHPPPHKCDGCGFEWEGPTDNPNAQIASATATCAICVEPMVYRNGEYVHAFTNRAQCTYKSHL